MSTAPIEQFIKKYQTAKNYNSKELRLTMQEAEELSIAMSLMIAHTATLSGKIIDLQDQLLVTMNEIKVSGGTF